MLTNIFYPVLFYFISFFKFISHKSVNLFYDPLRVKPHNFQTIDKQSINFSDVYFLQWFLPIMYKFGGGDQFIE